MGAVAECPGLQAAEAAMEQMVEVVEERSVGQGVKKKMEQVVGQGMGKQNATVVDWRLASGSGVGLRQRGGQHVTTAIEHGPTEGGHQCT